MIVAVYGTLKKGHHNHTVMESAKGVFLKEDYVEVDSLTSCGFPKATFREDTGRWLKVELYEVKPENVEHLDWLEGYTEGQEEHNFYNRRDVLSLSGLEVIVYEINEPIGDELSNYLEDTDMPFGLFYNWN